MPAIPLVRSRQSVQGAAGALDRSYSNVVATADMFGAHSARALASAGQAIGSGLSSLSDAFEEYQQRDRNEKVAAAVATNPLAPTALEVQQNSPADGNGLVQNTTNALRQKIEEDAARLFPNDPKAATQYKIRKYGEMGHYVTNSATMQQGMRLEYSKQQTDTALNATDNTVRTDPSGYELALKQGIDVINSSLVIPDAMKEGAKLQWAQRLANTRFEGMLMQAKSVEDLEAIERELTVKGEDGKPNEWQSRLRSQDYEKLLDRVRTGKNTFASKATTEANAALEKYEKMTEGRTIIPAADLQELRKMADASHNGVVMLRFSRLARDQEILTSTRGLTPAQMYDRSNVRRGGAAVLQPGVPHEVSGYIGEATTVYPGVSASYLASTAVKEYGANFRTKEPITNAPGVQVFEKGRANAAYVSDFWGNPLTPDFKQKHISTVQTSNGTAVEVNSRAAPAFQGFLNELETRGYKIKSISGYNVRNKRGGDTLSQHSWGNAIDINADDNPMMGKLKTDMPPDISDLAAKYGLTWGGDWRGTKDTMHFEWSGVVTPDAVRHMPVSATDYGRGTSIKDAKGNPTSSALGLFQFTDNTWYGTDASPGILRNPDVRAMFKNAGYDLDKMSDAQIMDLRKDPRASTLGAAALAAQNKRTVEGALGRQISDAELYMAHFMGASGATNFLRAYQTDKTAVAADMMPKAAEANKPIFYRSNGTARTVGEVYDVISAQYSASPTMVAYGDAQTYQKLADAKRKGLANNPMREAANDGVVANSSLDGSRDAWSARGQNVRKVAGYYQMPVEDTKPFDSETEVQSLKQQVSDGTTEQVVNLLKNMAAMDAIAPGSMNAGLDQLGHKNSAYGVAGDLMLKGDADSAIAVVQGAKMLATESSAKGLLSQDGGGRRASDIWNETTQKALIGVSPEFREALYQAANAHYVATYAPTVKDFKPDLYKKSVNAVLGGRAENRIAEVNGEPTVLPNGVHPNEMNNAVDNITSDDLIKYAVDTKGKPSGTPPRYSNGDVVNPADIAVQAKLEYVGSDTYRVRMSDHTLLVSSDLSPYGRPYPYLIRLDAEAVKTINARPRDVERTRDLIGGPGLPWSYPFADLQ